MGKGPAALFVAHDILGRNAAPEGGSWIETPTKAYSHRRESLAALAVAFAYRTMV
jgi:hypothetical protein